jgi:hypothetical protein
MLGILFNGTLMHGILLSGILLSSILLSGILLSSILLSGILLSGILLSGILLSGILLSSILLSGILLSGITPNDVALSKWFSLLLKEVKTLFFFKARPFHYCNQFSTELKNELAYKKANGQAVCSSPKLDLSRTTKIDQNHI